VSWVVCALFLNIRDNTAAAEVRAALATAR